MNSARTFLISLSLFTSACGVETCRQRSSALETGVAGCTTTRSDVGPGPVQVAPNFEVQVFERAVTEGASPLFTTKSDDDGFYELAVPAGAYRLCASSDRCVELDVASAQVVRMNYQHSRGPGWSAD